MAREKASVKKAKNPESPEKEAQAPPTVTGEVRIQAMSNGEINYVASPGMGLAQAVGLLALVVRKLGG